ncbi:CPBP family intramembrane glutamic endopeptidase [Bacillus toyonensis]|uniref:CPBP family intramembrane glutamic endopeptidase n=1 Tax=Bacillus toyonensis TaxID=155322 RepID=UPI001F0E8914|nr:type II CAAX endopeptidase family protein [Bacillus toyonensis]MCH5454865.1 CPBP family intramembrane metalloprotease [Bacillus toyonensis]HDR7471644.1 CPBP family intramembrane metalloprotease [Bacillus toyonensis]
MNTSMSKMKIRHIIGWILVSIISLEFLSRASLFNNIAPWIKQEVILVSAIYLIPILWFYNKCKKQKIYFYSSFFSKPSVFPIKTMIAAVIMPFFLVIGIVLLLLAIAMSFNILEGTAEATVLESKSGLQLLVSSIIIAVIAPIAEEIIFRGYLFNRLSFRLGIKKAIIISSIVFGILHLQNIFGATILGISMCVLYIKTKSLIVPIIVHMVSNIFVVFKDISLFMSPSESSTSSTADLDVSIGFIGAFLFIGIGLLWFIPFIKRNWKYCIEKGIPSFTYESNIKYNEKKSL